MVHASVLLQGSLEKCEVIYVLGNVGGEEGDRVRGAEGLEEAFSGAAVEVTEDDAGAGGVEQADGGRVLGGRK